MTLKLLWFNSKGRYSFSPMAFDKDAGFCPFGTGPASNSKIIIECTKTTD